MANPESDGAAGPPALPNSMPTYQPTEPSAGAPSGGTLRVLFVGRQSSLAATLHAIFAQPEPATRPAIEFTALTSQKAALRLVRHQPPNVFLIEVDGKPDSRQRFCETLRARLPTSAILGIGPQPPQSFDFDQFFSPPLQRDRLLAAVERLRDRLAEPLLQRGPLRLDLATRTVYTPRGSYHLTPKQCALLHLLLSRHNQTVARGEIMAAIWNTSYLDDTRTLDVHIRWLRECIEPDPSKPRYLVTERGVGYRLTLP